MQLQNFFSQVSPFRGHFEIAAFSPRKEMVIHPWCRQLRIWDTLESRGSKLSNIELCELCRNPFYRQNIWKVVPIQRHRTGLHFTLWKLHFIRIKRAYGESDCERNVGQKLVVCDNTLCEKHGDIFYCNCLLNSNWLGNNRWFLIFVTV